MRLVASLVMTPVVCDHEVAPDSKPGLATRLPPPAAGCVPHVVPLTLMAAKAFATPAHCALVAPYRSVAALRVAVRAPA